MTNSTTRMFSAHEIEHLLASLTGVRSARVLIEDGGRITEIHVLCSPALQAKQVVRNVESALSAGLGIHIDRRIISVAQLRDDIADVDARIGEAGPTPLPSGHTTSALRSEAAPPDETGAPTRAPATPPVAARTAAARRFVFVGFDARTQAGTTFCRVQVRRGRRELAGEGTGPNTSQGRAAAAAEALFDAVGRADGVGQVTLDGAVLVELAAKPFVLVSAVGAGGRDGVQLTGIAALVRSPEEAAILAALQAANRWAEAP